MLPTKLFAALLTVLLCLGAVPALSSPTETAAPEVPVTQVTEPASQTVTYQQAEEISLGAVGISAADAVFSPAELDRERGNTHWDIDFRSGDWEYDFEIDAATGEILRWEKEYDPEKSEVTQPPATEPAKTAFTAEDAKAAALAHAGLTADQVAGMKVEKDKENGLWVFEVEFRQGRLEFEYEIHAETGAVLKWEKDYD